LAVTAGPLFLISTRDAAVNVRVVIDQGKFIVLYDGIQSLDGKTN
jgi:hypothetical protein